MTSTLHNMRSMRRVLLAALFVSAGYAPATQAAVVVSSDATQNMSCSAGVCTPTATRANLNVADLANMLSQGDVKVLSDSASQDIDFSAPLSWTSASRLILESYRSIVFRRALVIAGTGALTVVTNESGNGGDYTFEQRGHVEFWDLSSSLVIDGTSYVLVTDIHQLAKKISKTPSGAFALARNYNAAKDGVYPSAPVSTTFSGTFEGLGHRIANLTIDQTTGGGNVGLFADTNGGILRDVRLINAKVTVTGSAGRVGALVGGSGVVYYPQTAALANDIVEAQVSAPNDAIVGGLAGSSSGSIINSTSKGSVTGGTIAGGLVGLSLDPAIFYSHSSATVYSSAPNGNVGGLAGDQTGQLVFQSYATGSVTGSVAGGLIGSSSTDRVQDSFATGSVTAGDNEFAGGLIGIYSSGGNVRLIANTYAMGSVSAGTNGTAGGLLGDISGGQVSGSYATGAVSSGSDGFGGGLVGGSGPGIVYGSDYWDFATSRTKIGTASGNVPGVMGLTTAKFKSHLPRGFSRNVWYEDAAINDGFPYLRGNPPPQ